MWAMKSMCKTEVSSSESVQKTQWAVTPGDKRRKKQKNKKLYLQKNGRPARVRVQFRVPDTGRQHVKQEESPQNKSQKFQRCVAFYLQPIRSSHRRRTPLPSAGQRQRQAGLWGELVRTRWQKSSSPIYTSASVLYTCNWSALCSQGSMFPRRAW